MKTNKNTPLFVPEIKDHKKVSFQLSNESISLLDQYCEYLSATYNGRKFEVSSILDKLIVQSLLHDKGFKEWLLKNKSKA